MSTHKHINKICIVAAVIAILLTVVLMNGDNFGIKAASRTMGYEGRLFDTTKVHTIEIVMEDWDDFIKTSEDEEYAVCSVVIDGEAYKNVGIRAKGNTSLSTVSSMDSDRYSFKIEFDQYDNTKTYYGLDKLSLNNVIQDTTYMKDYLTYQMMREFGVDAPLCSYVYITVNGEEWGLYLAVEGVEDAFLSRNYGNDYGELYKPDSLSFGGGRGNGMDFDMNDFMKSGKKNDSETKDTTNSKEEQNIENNSGSNMPNMPGGNMPEGFDPSTMPGGNGSFEMPEGFDPSTMPGNGGFEMPEGFDPSTMSGNGEFEMPEGFDPSTMSGGNDSFEMPEGFDPSTVPEGGESTGRPGGFGAFSMGGMGSSDVKLQYIDDDPDSYSNIFNNAKTDISDADKKRLIESLQALSAGENIEDVVDIEKVIRYFVVHNFVNNNDSYTGMMVHNYYLYEEDGQLTMIPWDYNLAYGTFQSSDATSTVNAPIDSPVSGGSIEDRPMISWIFSNEEYTQLYHQYYSEFLERVDMTELIDTTKELIASYVEKDPTKFYTYEEFVTGVTTIREYCQLRKESIKGQLSGTIASTTSEQAQDSSTFIDASHITISDMGSMGGGMGGKSPSGMLAPSGGFDRGNQQVPDRNTTEDAESSAVQSPSIKGEDNNSRKEFFQGMQEVTPKEQGSTMVVFAVTIIVLLAGLLVAFKFKRT